MPALAPVTMFKKVNALPGSQRQPASKNRDRQIRRRQGRAHMGGHIVVTFGRVDKKPVAIRNQAAEKSLQIAPDIRVRILLDEERSGGVAQMQRQQAGLALVLRQPIGRVSSHFIEAAPASANL